MKDELEGLLSVEAEEGKIEIMVGRTDLKELLTKYAGKMVVLIIEEF